MADRVAVLQPGPARAVRHADRDLRPARARCSSTHSSAPPTCCAGTLDRGRAAAPRRARSTAAASSSARAPPRRRRARRRASSSACGPSNLRITDGAGGIAGTVEMGLPLGATIVHEVRTADGASRQDRRAARRPAARAARRPARRCALAPASPRGRHRLSAAPDPCQIHTPGGSPCTLDRRTLMTSALDARRHARLSRHVAARRRAAWCSRPSPAAGRRRTRTCWCRPSARPTTTPRSCSTRCCRSTRSPRSRRRAPTRRST